MRSVKPSPNPTFAWLQPPVLNGTRFVFVGEASSGAFVAEGIEAWKAGNQGLARNGVGPCRLDRTDSDMRYLVCLLPLIGSLAACETSVDPATGQTRTFLTLPGTSAIAARAEEQ
jgi:hypothetical protein